MKYAPCHRRLADFTCTRNSRVPESTMKSYRSLSPYGFDTANPRFAAFNRKANSASSPLRFEVRLLMRCPTFPALPLISELSLLTLNKRAQAHGLRLLTPFFM
jgi:hypothetical protein